MRSTGKRQSKTTAAVGEGEVSLSFLGIRVPLNLLAWLPLCVFRRSLPRYNHRVEMAVLMRASSQGSLASRRGQSFRGVTWDKMKKMWRVRVCLAGGGREHVGYFLNEKEGALAYTKALARISEPPV